MKIVLSGGPSAGKTSIAKTLVQHYGSKLVVIPEAASLLYTAGFPRRSYQEAILRQQQAIFQVQRSQEFIYQQEAKGKVVVCDRGTLDSLAFFNEVESRDFLEYFRTTKEKELAKYDAVIYLHTPDMAQYDQASNPVRTEDFEAARKLDQRFMEAWKDHPNFVSIQQTEDFLDKILAVRKNLWGA